MYRKGSENQFNQKNLFIPSVGTYIKLTIPANLSEKFEKKVAGL
jgi:hypothetical protein